MNKKCLSYIALCSILVFASSCLGSSDDELEYYYDAALTSFSLGTVNQYVHTQSSTGTDSTYVVKVTGSHYKFYIDQLKHEVYNVDSLPMGSDAKHLICTIGAKNGGYIAIQSLTSDSLSYYTSTDSLDFSVPRKIVVYNSNASAYTKYSVRVNVHQEDSNSFVWTRMADNASLAAFKSVKAVSTSERIWLFGSDGTSTRAYYTSLTDGNSWTALSTSFSADAWKNVSVSRDVPYVLSGSKLYAVHTDGLKEFAAGSAKRLVAGSGSGVYAITEKGEMLLFNGSSWQSQRLDGSADMLPSQDYASASLPALVNDSTDMLLLAGSRGLAEAPADTCDVVWQKVDEYSAGSSSDPWAYAQSNQRYVLPRMANLQLFAYDGSILAIGGEGLGANSNDALTAFYQTYDKGLTWKKSTLYALPAAFSGSKSCFAVVSDKNNFIWIFAGDTGQVWRGRLNRLGWAKVKKYYND